MGDACSSNRKTGLDTEASEEQSLITPAPGSTSPPATPKEGAAPKVSSNGMVCGAVCGCLLAVIFIVVAVVYMYIQNFINEQAENDFLNVQYKYTTQYSHTGLTPASLQRNSWWPGCGYTSKSIGSSDNFSCLEPCFPGSVFAAMEKSFQDHPAVMVEYHTRAHPDVTNVTLRGWLFPAVTDADEDAVAPRMVIQHGFTSHSNEFRAQLWAYMFRSLGFTVLVNNVRDHGYSDNTTDALVGWGHSYPWDLLGAWDYMVKDPDNKMGGEVDPSKVGITGYSMGAFITSIAFGLEPEVPGVWLDSAPLRPKMAFEYKARQALEDKGLGMFSKLLLDKAWSSVVEKAKEKGVGIEDNIPEEVLPEAADTQRPVFWWHNTEDKTVSIKDGRKLLALFEKYPEKFKVSKEESTGQCHGKATGAHCVDHLREHTEVGTKLCSFFSAALDVKLPSCGGGRRLFEL